MAIYRIISVSLIVACCIIAANAKDNFLRRVLDETKPPAPKNFEPTNAGTGQPSCHPSEIPSPYGSDPAMKPSHQPTLLTVESSGKGTKGGEKKSGQSKAKGDKAKGKRRLDSVLTKRCGEVSENEAAYSKGGKGSTVRTSEMPDDTKTSKGKGKDENVRDKSGNGKGKNTEGKGGKGKGNSGKGKGSKEKGRKGKGSVEVTAVPSEAPSHVENVSIEPSVPDSLQPTVLFSAVPTTSSLPTEVDDDTFSLNAVYQNDAGEGVLNVDIQAASEMEGSQKGMSKSSKYGLAVTMAVVGVVIGFVVAKLVTTVN